VQVLVRDNNVDQALKALKKKMQREGIFREMKLRGHYEKPSEKKAREKAEAIRRARKLARKKMQREGIFREMKLRGAYEKPSEKRARERAEAVRRYRKLQRKRLQRDLERLLQPGEPFADRWQRQAHGGGLVGLVARADAEHQHERQRGGHVVPGAAAEPGDAQRPGQREHGQAGERVEAEQAGPGRAGEGAVGDGVRGESGPAQHGEEPGHPGDHRHRGGRDPGVDHQRAEHACSASGAGSAGVTGRRR